MQFGTSCRSQLAGRRITAKTAVFSSVFVKFSGCTTLPAAEAAVTVGRAATFGKAMNLYGFMRNRFCRHN